jgi:hypothetical protein
MDKVARLPGSLAELARAHPDTVICQVDGVWHAWIPLGDYAGAEIHGQDEDELLAKLTAALGA